MGRQGVSQREEIKHLIASVLGLPSEKVGDNLALGEVPEWDSLGHMDLLMTLEARYGIPLDEDMIARLISVDAICAYLEEREHG